MSPNPLLISSAQSLTKKLSLYFNGIALAVGMLVFFLSQAGLYWLEDEINKRNLNQTAQFAIEQFQQGALSPLVIGPNILAYDTQEELPVAFRQLANYPAGYNDEITDDIAQDLFFNHSSFSLNGETKSLYLTMEADKVELSNNEWRYINIASLAVMILLYLALDFAIKKLSKRLVHPINQLSQQLKVAERKAQFTVPKGSALEFSELANSLNSYHQQNEQLIKQEQSFAKYASHELRTPLTVIQGAAKLLDKSNNPDFQQRQKQRIAKSAADMQHTIEALLSLVKQEQAKENTNRRKLTKNEMEQVIEDLLPLSTPKNIQLILDMNTEPDIQPSPPVLRMLLINLIQNAINASDAGVIILKVQSSNIQVIDEGRGLSNSEHNIDGHGLGLLIVDALCERYAWTVSLTAGEQSGCVATLAFPERHNI